MTAPVQIPSPRRLPTRRCCSRCSAATTRPRSSWPRRWRSGRRLRRRYRPADRARAGRMVRARVPRPPRRRRACGHRPVPLDHRPGHARDRGLRPGDLGRPAAHPTTIRPTSSACSRHCGGPTSRCGPGSARPTANASGCTASAGRRATTSRSGSAPATTGSTWRRHGAPSRPCAGPDDRHSAQGVVELAPDRGRVPGEGLAADEPWRPP